MPEEARLRIRSPWKPIGWATLTVATLLSAAVLQGAIIAVTGSAETADLVQPLPRSAATEALADGDDFRALFVQQSADLAASPGGASVATPGGGAHGSDGS